MERSRREAQFTVPLYRAPASSYPLFYAPAYSYSGYAPLYSYKNYYQQPSLSLTHPVFTIGSPFQPLGVNGGVKTVGTEAQDQDTSVDEILVLPNEKLPGEDEPAALPF